MFSDNQAIDNALLPGHRKGYSGLARLAHTRRPENLFVGKFAGLNFEHIHDGTTHPSPILFEPREAHIDLVQESARTVLLHQPSTPHWQLESWLRYTLLPGGAIQLDFECLPHARTFENDTIGLFFASYIEKPETMTIFFRGRAETDTTGASWIEAATPAHGTLATHRAVDDARDFPHAADFPLTLVFGFSSYRFTRPWYYGKSHGMALVQVFRERDQVRFSQSPSGGGNGNPAWDFQWFIANYQVGQRYRFAMRAIYLPFESPEQIEAVAERHVAELAAHGS